MNWRFPIKGSQVRLPHQGPPTYPITVPLHNRLKTGTLHGVLTEVALMRSITVDSLVERLCTMIAAAPLRVDRPLAQTRRSRAI